MALEVKLSCTFISILRYLVTFWFLSDLLRIYKQKTSETWNFNESADDTLHTVLSEKNSVKNVSDNSCFSLIDSEKPKIKANDRKSFFKIFYILNGNVPFKIFYILNGNVPRLWFSFEHSGIVITLVRKFDNYMNWIGCTICFTCFANISASNSSNVYISFTRSILLNYWLHSTVNGSFIFTQSENSKNLGEKFFYPILRNVSNFSDWIVNKTLHLLWLFSEVKLYRRFL